jgi:RNA polymerase sigma factor (sigma-70 family)
MEQTLDPPFSGSSRRPGRAAASLGQARAGSRPGIEAVARDVWPEAYRVALLSTGDRYLAEEIAQETTASTLANLSSIDDEASLLAWVRRVAVNRCVDNFRSAHTRRTAPGGSAEEVERLRQTPPANQTSDPALAVALGRLDADDRLAVVLRHVLGYRADEVAELLGVPAGTLRSRIHRALAALKQDLERDDTDG